MPSSLPVKDLIKDLDLPKGFAVRLRRPAKNGPTQCNLIATHYDRDHFIPADIPMHPGSLARDPGLEVSTNPSSTRSFGRVSLAREASDMAQPGLPLVQVIPGAIPLAGPPMQIAITGLLTILQAINRRSQNISAEQSPRRVPSGCVVIPPQTKVLQFICSSEVQYGKSIFCKMDESFSSDLEWAAI
ncbi:hypothetical protein EDB19DRAFT_631173 [Suillus lakei]|nr:hypothetical protein EDB19DRAFT_631173 [Suillus lakei]